MPSHAEALRAVIQRHLDALRQHGLISRDDRRLNRKWTVAADEGLAALVATDGRLDLAALRNFRSAGILTHDVPAADISGKPIRNRLIGWRRGTRHCLLQCLEILREHGCDDLLLKYPCHPAGNPHCFAHDGYRYTFRWTRHVYFLGMLRKFLAARLGAAPVVLDIGSSYGIFSSLVRREYPGSCHVLVDLPEQLILAHYFLGSCLPEARIAGPADVLSVPVVTRDFVRSHDFVLVPTVLFDRLPPDTVDLVVNFGSFGEMSRQYFEAYAQSPVFLSAKYLLMANRVAAVPEQYGNDISVLDYPIHDRGKRMHFEVCPMYSVDFQFTDLGMFRYSVTTPAPHFEYVGRICGE